MTVSPQMISRAAVQPPRLGFVGVGWIGRQRLAAIAASGVAEIAVVADLDPEISKAAATLAREAVTATSLDEVLAHGIDGVVIATPNALHAQQSIAALTSGIPVFCQKPLGRTEDETRGVINAARTSNRLIAVDMSYRFTEAMVRIRDVIAGGEIGEIYAINLVFHNAYGPDKKWFYDPRLSGGGCLLDLGVHLVDLALWVTGFPEAVTISSCLKSGGRDFDRYGAEVEDYASALLKLETGASVQLACSWKLHAGSDCRIEAAFYGTRGGASFRNVDGSFAKFIAERFIGTKRIKLCGPPDDWGGRAAVNWARQLRRNGSFDAQAEEISRVASVLENIYDACLAHASSPCTPNLLPKSEQV